MKSKPLPLKLNINKYHTIFQWFYLFGLFIGLPYCTSTRSFKLPAELEEVSGLSVQDDQHLWWHNDSGHPPYLFLTNQVGDMIDVDTLPTENQDWEDLTADDQGRLYIGDLGNQRQADQPLAIHRYDAHSGELQTFLFQYDRSDLPTQGNRGIDCEAMFWYQHQLYLFTKAPPNSEMFNSHMFTLQADGTQQLATWTRKIAFTKRMITGAAIHSASGKVAFVSYRYGKLLGILPWSQASVWWTTIQQLLDEDPLSLEEKRFAKLFAKQYESIDFLNEHEVLVASEQTLFFKPKVRKLKLE